MAPDPDPIKPVSERYCSHMNKDHADAVLYYVHYFASRKDAVSARMLSIDASGTDISFTTKGARTERCRVSIEPKLKDPGEGRQRLIEMMYEAIEGLGLSKHPVNVWESPDAFSWVLIGLILFTYPFLLSSDSQLSSISPPLLTFRSYLPQWFQLSVLFFVPIAHFVEAQFILGPQLKKYRVDAATGWKWWGSVMAVGGPAIRHFVKVAKREVRRQEREMAAKKDKH